MRTVRLLSAVALLLPLAVPCCTVGSSSFVVPSQVHVGAIAELHASVTSPTTSTLGGYLGCVIQVPGEFAFLGYDFTQVGSSNATVSLTPQPPNPYVAEPGHYLVAMRGSSTFSSGSSATGGSAKIWFRAPSTPGTFTFKVAFLADGGNVPSGITQFAQITGQTMTVTTAHPVVFDLIETVSTLPSVPIVADVDRDGRDDVVLTSATSTQCWLSRTGPAWTPTTPLAGGGYAATGDFDGDGNPDLVTTAGTVSFGDGAGGFVAGPGLAPSSTRVVAGDVDHDGRDDIVFATGGAIAVFHGRADRTFVAGGQGLPATPSQAAGTLVLCDANGDGNLDLFAAETTGNNFWLGDGHGNWTPSPGAPYAQTAMSACAIDIDGDGSDELVVNHDSAPSNHTTEVYRHGAGGWAPDQSSGFVLSPSLYEGLLATIDFDRDGHQDLLVAVPQGALLVWRNNGNGTLQPISNSGLTTFDHRFVSLSPFGITSLVVGDLDGDTFPDLVLETPNWVRVYLTASTGVAAFGAGCGNATLAAPSLQAIGRPSPGNQSFALQVQAPLPNTLGFFWFGDSRTAFGALALPLDLGPFGASGCTLWSEPEQSFALTFDAAGRAIVALPVPALPSLSLATFFGQALAAAPAANPAGVLLSAGIAMRID